MIGIYVEFKALWIITECNASINFEICHALAWWVRPPYEQCDCLTHLLTKTQGVGLSFICTLLWLLRKPDYKNNKFKLNSQKAYVMFEYSSEY